MLRTRSFSKTLLINMSLGGAVALGLLGAMWIYQEYARFGRETRGMRSTAMEERKALVQKEVTDAVELIRFNMNQTDTRLMASIRTRVEDAHRTAAHLYETYHRDKSLEEVKQLVREALRPARFNREQGYYFINSLDGVAELNSAQPQLEGRNLFDLRDSRGTYVVRNMVELARTQGAGFTSYTWPKPGEPEGEYPKISFVKHFEPLGWVIGAGEYRDEVEREIQQDVLSQITKLRFGPQGKDYLFVGQWDGLILTHPAKGTNQLDRKDPNGVMIIRELIDRSRQGGGFVSYVMPGLGDERPEPKISYAAGIRPWRWFVGAGVYLGDIDQSVAAARRQLQRGVQLTVLKIGLLLVGLLLVAFWVSARTATRTREAFEAVTSFLGRSRADAARLDARNSAFVEIRVLAEAADQILGERRQAEADLRQSERRYRGLMDASPDAMVVYDPDGSTRYVNDAFETLYGWTREEVIGGRMDRFVPEEEAAPSGDAWSRILAGERLFFETRRVAKDGRTLDIQITGSVVRDDAGSHTASIVVHRDITELKREEAKRRQLEVQAQHSQRLESLGVLAGGIAHDLNNVLTPIIGFAELAAEDLPPDSTTRGNLDQVVVAGERARDLVSQILVFGRKNEAKTFPLHLTPLIEETLKLLRATLPATIEIRSELSPDDLAVANPSNIHQILMNLGANAGHAMAARGGVLSVQLETAEVAPGQAGAAGTLLPGPHLLLTVSDTGHGIPPDRIGHIFDPFYTTKGVGEGSGMGLAVVHGIVQRLGGAVDVESAPGQWSRFRIWLPQGEEILRPTEEPRQELQEGHGEHILFVDDEEMIVGFWEQALDRLGYRVTRATTGQEALELFRTDPEDFDVVVTDQTMPGLSGDQLIVEILRVRPETPVLLCTGHSATIDREGAMDLGARGFLNKPFTIGTMGEALRHALDPDSTR